MSLPRRCRALAAVAALLLSALAALAPASPAEAAANWYEGNLQYSRVVSCPSIIQGAPQEVNGAGAWAGFYGDPDAAKPAPNQTFYVRVAAGAIANTCSGQWANVELELPAGLSVDIRSGWPVKCFYDNTQLGTNECPQSLPQGSGPGRVWIPSINAPSPYLWPLPVGNLLSILVPVKATGPLSNATVRFHVKVFDGNEFPTLTPEVGVWVFSGYTGGGSNASMSVTYPAPSTAMTTDPATAATTYRSEAYLETGGVGGNAYFDLATSAAGLSTPSVTDGPAVVPAGNVSSFLVWADWTPFVPSPGVTYYWRMRYVPSSGPPVLGAIQSFTAPLAGAVTIGNGTAASCTADALNTAIATSAVTKIAFDCGLTPVSITMTGPPTITRNLEIDGGGQVTLVAPFGRRHFTVSGRTFTVRRLTLTGANHTFCGGALSVENGGAASLDRVIITGNLSGAGGGACVADKSSSLSVDRSSISGNSSSGPSGAIQSFGSLEIQRSELSGNTAVGDGGAIAVGTDGYLDLRYSTLADNKAGTTSTTTKGGAIYAAGSFDMLASTLYGNAAGLGGAIAITGASQSSVASSTVARNTARSISGGSPGYTLQTASLYPLRVANTLLVDNTPVNCAFGGITAVGVNLEQPNTSCAFGTSGSARVGSELVYDGGSTRVLRLLPGSAAIDAGDNTYCGQIDQRGANGGGEVPLRGIDGDGNGSKVCDIGAFELQPMAPSGFTDVSESYQQEPVRWLKQWGITTGYGGSTTTFAPTAAVTRGQMGAFLWRLMGEPPVATAHGFTDVASSAFYDAAVRWLKDKAITTGYGSPTTFSPGANVTRGEMAAFLWRLAGKPAVTDPHGFGDVTASYQEVPVRWLKKNGITTGYGGPTTFAPDAPVTRGQMAAFLYRLAGTEAAWNLPATQRPASATYR